MSTINALETSKPLLDSDEYTDETIVHLTNPLQARSSTAWRRVALILGVAYMPLLVLYGIMYSTTVACNPQFQSTSLFPSLREDQAFVKYRRIKMPVQLGGNPFVGNPSPTLDHAWHGLFEDVNIRITQQDLDFAGVDSLMLADGSGEFVGQLGVHHELHCLKRVRHWIYRDYYHPNLTSEAFTENKVHIDHCIELLRMATMCRASTSLSSFKWLEHGSEAVTETRDASYHSCVDFDRLMEWVRGRSVDLFDHNALLRPGMGHDVY